MPSKVLKHQKHYIFSNGGAKKEAKNFDIPYLGELPLDKKLRIQSDEGKPTCIDDPNGKMSLSYLKIAEKIDNSLK